jgi:integrase
MNFPQYKFAENYDDRQKVRYLDLLQGVGSDICFDENTWVCDKRIRNNSDPSNYVNIYFSTLPLEYKKLVKYFSIIKLLQGDTVRTVRSRINRLVPFMKFLRENCSSPLISDCDSRIAVRLKEYLDMSEWSVNTKKGIWLEAGGLLRTMDGFDGRRCKNPFAANPYARITKLEYKYIPERIAGELDEVFRKEEIELHIRCIYWILRLIPSRISEVLAMQVDCVKPYNGNFVIFIPTWKQNGGNMEPVMRSIHLENTGIAAYLLELIWSQQKIAAALQERLPENKQGCLFSYQRILHYKKGGTSQAGVANNIIQSFVEYHFKRICRQYEMKDEDGKIYNLTSHQFRHNGITDRLEAGFTMEQIADMTGHHGNAMIWNAYAHLNLKPETILKKQRYVLEEPLQTESKYILFGGRILNMEEMLEKRLLKNLRAHRVPGGICGDVTGCKSDMWNCLACGHFIPDSSQTAYFEEQISSWQEKAKRFERIPMVRDNAIKNAGLFEVIVKRIRLENMKNE